ncbi:tyrosine-type recombinase/integrase, partial [Bacteroides uniformis]
FNSFFKLKDNSNINKELNILAGLAKIDKRVSFHTASHTNATLLLYNGANITTVQKLLGHKSVKTTQVYANIMDITVVRDLEKTASSKK